MRASNGAIVDDALSLGCTGGRGPIVDLLDPRLLAFWSFNDTASPEVDYSPSNVPLVPTMAPSTRPMLGNGISAFATILQGTPPAGGLSAPMGFTVEAWTVIAAGACPNTAFYFAASPGWGIGCENKQPYFAVVHDDSSVTRAASSTPITDDLFHHLVGVARPRGVELWLDGVVVAQQASAADRPLQTEGDLGAGAFGGAIDELRLWRTALEVAELTTLGNFIRPGLLRYWTLDANNTTFAGLPGIVAFIGYAFVPGRAGGAFKAAGGHLGADPDPTFDFGDDYTVSLWVQTTATGIRQQLASIAPGVDAREPLDLWLDGTMVRANVRSSDGSDLDAEAVVNLSDGCWHHVAVVRAGADNSAGSVRLYVDGVRLDEQLGTFGVTAAAGQSILFAAHTSQEHRLDGSLDEISIYDRALTDDEIAGIHATLR